MSQYPLKFWNKQQHFKASSAVATFLAILLQEKCCDSRVCEKNMCLKNQKFGLISHVQHFKSSHVPSKYAVIHSRWVAVLFQNVTVIQPEEKNCSNFPEIQTDANLGPTKLPQSDRIIAKRFFEFRI
jgi:hypothetical protein